MGIVISSVAGVLFGLGLIISGMADPAKVLNFLDLAGTWDPSLAFVMAGAIAVTFLGYRFVLRRPAPLLADKFHLPSRTKVDHQLIIGATVFGIGWGLAGFCPGPAVVSLALLAKGTIVFTVAMIAGILLGRTQRHAERHIAPSTEPAA